MRRRRVAERVVVRGTEGPERERDFEHEEGCDRERHVREHSQPRGRTGALDGRAVGREEGVPEVSQYACGVDDDLEGCL